MQRFRRLSHKQRFHLLLVFVRHGEHPVVKRHHRKGHIARLGTDARGTEGYEQRFFAERRRGGGGRLVLLQIVAQSGEDCADCILADGWIVEGGVQRVWSEDWGTADAGDYEVDDGVLGCGVGVWDFGGGSEGLGDALWVTDVALDDGEVGVDGGFGDFAVEEEVMEFRG